jgi:GTPase SAR1 family protein
MYSGNTDLLFLYFLYNLVVMVSPEQNPFVPFTGADPPHFAGREVESAHFKRLLQATLDGHPAHAAFLGDFGSGKTILLKMCRKIAELRKAKTVPIRPYSMTEPAALVNLIASTSYRAIPQSEWKQYKVRLENIGFQVLGPGVSAKITYSEPEPQTILEVLLNETYKLVQAPIVLTIDDFQEVSDRRNFLTILRNVLMALSEQNARVMLVVAGTEDVLGAAPPKDPINRFFLPKIVGPLSESEIQKAVEIPLKDRKVSISPPVIQKISELSEGNPFYVQLLAYHFYEQRKGNKIDHVAIPEVLPNALNDLAQRMYLNMLTTASPSERQLLRVFLTEGRPLTAKELRDLAPSYGLKSSGVNPLVSRLQTKGLVRNMQPSGSSGKGTYFIRDRLFTEYLRQPGMLEE